MADRATGPDTQETTMSTSTENLPRTAARFAADAEAAGYTTTINARGQGGTDIYLSRTRQLTDGSTSQQSAAAHWEADTYGRNDTPGIRYSHGHAYDSRHPASARRLPEAATLSAIRRHIGLA